MLEHYEDFVYRHWDILAKKDARLSDLPNEALDEAVYIWLTTHKSWYPDIYPATFSTGVCDIATEMLFGKKPVASKIVSNLFIAMAEDDDSNDRDDLWWSCAGYLDEIVNVRNFAEEFREKVYLYLECDLEDEIFNDLYSLQRQGEQEHGIYRCEIQGNC